MDELPSPSESRGSHVVSEAIGRMVLRRAIVLIVACVAAFLGTAILFFGPGFFRWWDDLRGL